MKNIFLLISLMVCCHSISQNQFTLKSSEDDNAIKYANIYAYNKLISSTDSLGNFKIDSRFLKSIIKITALGYKTLDSVSLKDSSIIYMETETILLNEIVVSNKIGKIKQKLGKAKNGNVGIVCTLGNNTISQVAKFFKKETVNKAYIEKIRFKTLCTEENRILSIYIYSVSDNGEPYKIINSEDIICNLKKGHNTYDIDLNLHNISFPENGIFIALNYLFIEQNRCYKNENKEWYYYEPSIDAIETNNYLDSWYNLNGVWKKSNTYSLSMELTLTN
jgi:hypothetical protein